MDDIYFEDAGCFEERLEWGCLLLAADGDDPADGVDLDE